jgi:hypothetical protein
MVISYLDDNTTQQACDYPPAQWYHKMVLVFHPTAKGEVEHPVMDDAIMDGLNGMSTSGIKLK